MIKRIRKFFLDQLTQGISPHSLALACAIGAAMGIFPIFGATTTLAFLIGLALRLNQPVLQAANYSMGVFQLLLIPVFLRMGEWLTNSPRQALDPRVIVKEFWADIPAFFAHWGGAGLRAILAWSLCAPLAALLLYFILRIILARLPLPVKVEAEEPR